MRQMLFARLVDEFLAWAARALASSTVQAYRHQLEKIAEASPQLKVSDIMPAWLSASCKSWHAAQAVVRLLNWAVHEAAILPRHPLGRVRLPQRGMRRRTLTPRQIAQLMRSCRRRARAFVMGMRETFARPQEVRTATWEMLAADDPAMPLRAALVEGRAVIVFDQWKDSRRRKDASRPRVLLVSRRLGRLLARQLDRTPNITGPIWRNARGQAWTRNAVRCLFRRLRERAQFGPDHRGEQISAYTLRHSMATWAAARGMSDRLLADLLGHVEARTTARYQHLQTGHLREALDRARRGK